MLNKSFLFGVLGFFARAGTIIAVIAIVISFVLDLSLYNLKNP